MLKQQKLFFDFLRFCIGSAEEKPDSLKEADWKELYAIAKKQCLVGVLFDGIKKLPAEHLEMKKELLVYDFQLIYYGLQVAINGKPLTIIGL